MVHSSDEESAEIVRALSFGSVAEQYERYRPGYPEELVDLVVGHATGPIGSALEVGAGTGKATRLFASRGIEVIALEPDARHGGGVGEYGRRAAGDADGDHLRVLPESIWRRSGVRGGGLALDRA